MKYRIKTLCLFVVFSILTPVAPTVPVLATPTISASPAIGVSGTIVKVSGSEFGSFAGDQLELYFDDTLIKPDSGPISGAVYFQTTFVVPDSARSGYHFISIKGITGTVLAQKQFYVPEQEITLNVWSGTIGTTVKLSVRVFTQGKM